jgi:hypothetical protein
MSGNSSIFAAAIEDHLALKRRNRDLDEHLPLDEFVGDDPFANHPLFKSEADARAEEEQTGEHPVVAASPAAADTAALPAVDAEPTWIEPGASPDFRWD